MILLGDCPNCGIEDKIASSSKSYSIMQCGYCNKEWDNWVNLKNLIPVEVVRGNIGVQLYWPMYNDVPYKNLIVTFLNSALMAKFNLDVCFAAEGGLEGNGFELRNGDNEIGLYVDYGETKAVKTLDFYEKMMRNLFEEPLRLGNTQFRRGEILRLDEDEKTYSNALIFLFAAISDTASKNFAKKVLLKKDEVEQNPFTAKYIRGLTYEEIEKFFCPPSRI